MNVCSIRASQFLRQFHLVIWHKPRKEHILPDALNRLASANTNLPSQDPVYSELDTLFIYNAMLVAMNKDLAQRIVKGYESDPWWVKVLSQLSSNDALGDNKVFLPFVQKIPPTDADLYFLPRLATMVDNHGNEITAPPMLRSKLIYHVDYVSDMHHLCILISVVSEIIAITYGKGHPGFAQCYEIISRFWYIRSLTKLLRIFIFHCPQCL